jgi:hypothetical protein
LKLENLVKIGFTLPTATDLSAFFGNVAYIGNFTAEDLVSGFTMPANKVVIIDGSVALKQFLKPDTQYYKDIDTILAQKGNTQPNMSDLNTIIVFQLTDEDSFGEAFDNLMKTNANFSQITISSRNVEDIMEIGQKLPTPDRLFEAQTSDATISTNAEDNVAKQLADMNNDRIKITFHSEDSEAAAAGIMSIQAGDMLGSAGDIYSKISNVMPKEYSATIESNLDALNVSYYTSVNPINGGGVEQYATNIYYGGKMINGENAKRRRIRFYFDKILKARSVDFLAKKLTYQDSSGAVLESMLTAVFLEGQSNDLVVQNSAETNGFYLNVLSIADTRKSFNSLYLKQCYKVMGWYIDALTGQKVDISLTVDPDDSEKTQIERV